MSGHLSHQEVHNETEHLSRVAALLPAGIFSCDAAGQIIFFNRRAAELWGRTPGLNESLERFYSSYKIFLADGTLVTPVETPMLKALHESRAYRDVEAIFWRPDGSRFVVTINIDPVYDANGRLCGTINVFQDITHRKQTEEALHQSEERFRTLAGHAPVGIFMTDLAGNTLSVNEHWCRMTGVNAEEARDHGWLRALHDDDRDRIAAGWIEALKKRAESAAEFRFLRGNGDVIWVQGHAVPLHDGKGRHIGYIGTIADMTERKRSEHAAQRLAAIVEQSEDAIVSKDLNSIITSWNRGAERIFGYSAEEAVGKSITLLIPPERHDEEGRIVEKIRRGESVEHYETIRRRKDGRLIDISLTISPIKDKTGKIVGASKIARDITDRKRDEERHRVLYELVAGMNRGMELPQLYDAALDAILRCQNADRASILLYDADRVMRFKAWQNLSDGYRRAVEGHSPWKPDDPAPQPVFIDDITAVELDEHLRQVVLGEGIRSLAFIPITYENRLLGKFMVYYNAPHAFTAGEIRPAQTVASQIGFALERKRSETELKRARDEAQRANRAKDDFLAALSHELRTPLNPVLLLASEAARNSDLPPGVRTDFDVIRKNVELEARLIDDLLDISRITCGKLVMEMEPVNVHGALAAALDKVHNDMQQKQIAFTINLAAPDDTVRGDGVRLQQVFWNLLKNAVKFTPPRGSIRLETRADNGELVIMVQDSGIGMTTDDLACVFAAFSQGERATAHQFGGLGLGLAISQSLVGSHSGRIRADSAGPGRGSTFTVTLPLIPAVARKQFRRHHGGATARLFDTKNEPLAILLVEDHEPTRTSLTQLLLRRRHKVTAASTLDEARALAAKENFDLLISDIGLPDGSGVELMKELAAQRELKGIALTGYGTEQDVIRSQAAGFSAHLTKPVRIESLDLTLAQIFEGKTG